MSLISNNRCPRFSNFSAAILIKVVLVLIEEWIIFVNYP